MQSHWSGPDPTATSPLPLELGHQALPGLKRLLLVGAGHAHLQVLRAWARQPLPGVHITLVSPVAAPLYSGMVPGLVAGWYARPECSLHPQGLAQAARVHWLESSVVQMDADQQTLTLDDGQTLSYDWLSLNCGAVQDRHHLEGLLPGARKHALFLRPLHVFADLWPRVEAFAQGRAIRLAVVGAGAAGIEIALALRQRFKQAAVTLIGSPDQGLSHYPVSAREHLHHALRQSNIAVIPLRAVGFEAGQVLLEQGASLACDVPILATGVHAPAWLQGSGLALDPQGFVRVHNSLCSTSHPHVMAAGDICAPDDLPHLRSGVYAVRAGPTLTHNLAALVRGEAPKAHPAPTRTLNLITSGSRRAVASWGTWSSEGRWAWWLKDWIDRRFVARHTVALR